METLQDENSNRTRQTRLPSKGKSGYDTRTGIYHSLVKLKGKQKIPTTARLGAASFVMSHFSKLDRPESRVAMIDAATNCRVTYGQLKESIHSLVAGLYHGLGVRKGDVVFLLSPNSTLYPTICLAVLLIGGVVTTANPVNTEPEIRKQVLDSDAKLAIAAPEEMHKLLSSKVPTLLTTRDSSTRNELSVEELIECCGSMVLPENRPNQSDTAAVLYPSGTTGTSKESEHGIFNAILRGHVDFTSDPWPTISPQAKDLVGKMLNSDPKQRITAHQVLSYPWIKEDGEAPDTPLDNAVMGRLKQFRAMNKFKKVALRVIAGCLSEEEIMGLKQVFKGMDTDNSGTITLEELKQADADGNGTIDYDEYLNRMDREEHLYTAFQYFDKDNSGYITIEEMEQAIREYCMNDDISGIDCNVLKWAETGTWFKRLISADTTN